jgi:hypothetical protein
MGTQSDIADILGEMARGPITCESKLERLLRHFAAHKIPLTICADKRPLGRAVNTLQRYARRMDLKFPDYVPMHLRPKKEKAAKRSR